MSSIRPQTVTLAAVAVIFGLVTAYGAKRILEPKPVVQIVQQPKTTLIVVAQTNLTPYARIGDRDAQAVEILLDEAPSAAMHVKGQAVGRLVKTTIMAGSPIREADLYEPGAVPQMADQLPPGFRAVTLTVEDAIASNGAILAGSFVDVSLTFDSDHPEVNGMATVNLMRNLKVLVPSPANKDAAIQSGIAMREKAYITVAATPEQANRLILAQQYGTINVTLCSNNEKNSDTLAEGNRNLINKYELLGLPPLPLLAVAEPPVRKVVEVYRASAVQQVVFNEAGDLLSTEEAVSPDSATTASAENVGAAERQPKAAGKKCATCGGKKKVQYGASPPSGGDTPATTTGASFNAGRAGQPTLAQRPTHLQPAAVEPSADNP